MIIQKALSEGFQILRTNNIKSALLDSEILMSEALAKKREYIILNIRNTLTQEKFNYFKQELLLYTGAHGDMFLNKIEDVIVIPQQYKDKNVGELTRISAVTGKIREGDSNFKETKIYPLTVT